MVEHWVSTNLPVPNSFEVRYRDASDLADGATGTHAWMDNPDRKTASQSGAYSRGAGTVDCSRCRFGNVARWHAPEHQAVERSQAAPDRRVAATTRY